MPRNGSGVYALPAGYAATANSLATAAQHNDPLEDLQSDANAARPVSAGGTAATTASGARTNLGVVIGSDVQAFNANLASLSGLTLAANKGFYSTAADTVALFDLTAAGRALLDDASAAAQRTTLGLGGLATLDILDEDDMATDSATRPPSQQSTKAYVDSTPWSYVSPAGSAIVSGGLITEAHGLGAQPQDVSFYLECISAEAGWSVGDKIWTTANWADGVGGKQVAVFYADATNVYAKFSTLMFIALDKSTGSPTGLTRANWEIYLRASL